MSERDLNVDQIVEERADKIFESLDAYSRNCITEGGTAFTTYEEHGDDVCKALERRCRAWSVANYDENGKRKT